MGCISLFHNYGQFECQGNKIHCVKNVLIRSYSGPHFLYLLNSVSLRILSECGKIRTRITPNTDTFYAVKNIKTLRSKTFFLFRFIIMYYCYQDYAIFTFIKSNGNIFLGLFRSNHHSCSMKSALKNFAKFT